MSRKSVLAMYAGGSLASEIPLRGYFLSVGVALLLLLLAANWMLPAPSPARPESQSTLPRIRIHSDVKGPEAVIIDTSRPVPMITADAIATPFPLSPGTDPIDVAQPTDSHEPVDGDTGNPSAAPIPPLLRESWAKLRPPLPDQAATDNDRAKVAPTTQRRRPPPRSTKRRRSARPLALDTPLSRCDTWSLERSSCRLASPFPQMN
jgi:hypothetical protein